MPKRKGKRKRRADRQRTDQQRTDQTRPGMNVNQRVGQRIRQLREARGKLSQEDLARALGLKWNAVSRWERGESKPSIVSLYRVAVYFERPMEYFVQDDPT